MISTLITDLFPFYCFTFRVYSTHPPSASQQILQSPAAQRPAIAPLAFLPRLAGVKGGVLQERKKEQKWIRKKKTRKKKVLYDINERRLTMPLHNTMLELWRGLHCFMLPGLKGRPVASILLFAIGFGPKLLFGYHAKFPFFCHEWNDNTATCVGVLS
jgi:hypothetical protein